MMNILENGEMILKMEMEFIYIIMKKIKMKKNFILEIGKKEKKMEKDFIFGNIQMMILKLKNVIMMLLLGYLKKMNIKREFVFQKVKMFLVFMKGNIQMIKKMMMRLFFSKMKNAIQVNLLMMK